MMKQKRKKAQKTNQKSISRPDNLNPMSSVSKSLSSSYNIHQITALKDVTLQRSY